MLFLKGKLSLFLKTDTEELFKISDGKVLQSVGGCYGKESCGVFLQIKIGNRISHVSLISYTLAA